MTRLGPGDPKKDGGLDLRVYLDLKNLIHRYLLTKLDLERIASAPDERTRGKVLAVIQDAVSRVKITLEVPEKERLSLEILDEVFGLGRLRRCCKTRRSMTSW